MKKITVLLTAGLLLSGCAVKSYPDSPPLSNVQQTQLDCQGAQKLATEQQQVQQQIDKKGEFDGLTVVGVLLDFGVGNGIAKSRAQSQADKREQQLQALTQAKCSLPG